MEDETNVRNRNKGPHGLGDPDDMFLRKVEKEIMIPKLVRERTKVEKCIEEVAAFSECAKESGLSMVLKCRKENDILQACLQKWWSDEDFKEDCKHQYLRERSEFRRSGLTKKQRTET